MVLDTCFLIDLQRERRRNLIGNAHRFAEKHQGERSYLAATAWGEFAEGFGETDEKILQTFKDSFEILPIDDRVAWRYSRLVRELRPRGQLIGTNDLWIGATALTHGLSLITRNAEEFRRIPGLDVIVY